MLRNILFTTITGLAALFFACKQGGSPNPAAATFANETDFVCGMKVKPEFTDTCHYQGKVYAFCSESCKDEFKANPESFLSKAGGQ